jgi:PAS domain S-box-containing protein
MATERTAAPIDLDDLAEAVRDSKHPVALVDLGNLAVLAQSAPATSRLGYRADAPIDLLAVAADPEAARRSFAEVRDGRFDAFEVARAVRKADGALVDGVVWVRAVEREVPRAHAVVVFLPAGSEVGGANTPDPSAMLALDRDQLVERVSADAEEVLGHTVATAVGRRLGDLVHPDDLDALVRTVASAADDQTCASNEIRVRGADGAWRPVDLTVAPMGATDQVGCRAAPAQAIGATTGAASDSTAAASARVAELERHLTRIAREVEAAGVIRDSAAVLDPERVPELGQLTARQWEILVRLLRGERVSTIARGMFLSPSTVRNYLSAMYQRLGVHSQAELIERFRKHDA